VEKTLIPLKAIVTGIKSPDIINHLHPYITEILAPALRSQVRRKHYTQNNIFEVYYLLLELSDAVTIELYDRKFVKQAVRRCEKSVSLFAVPLPLVPKANFSCNVYCGSKKSEDCQQGEKRKYQKRLNKVLKRYWNGIRLLMSKFWISYPH
jgi:hypothetical protein